RVDRPEEPRANAWAIFERARRLADDVRGRLRAGASPADLTLYEDAVLHTLYGRYVQRLSEAGFGGSGRCPFWPEFRADWKRYMEIPGVRLPTGHEPAHTLACCYQIVRAFHHIFSNIIGSSLAAARLRASVWQSIFSHDMRRYRRSLYARMGDFATLITGPSGTGKELVARAIAGSRYLPFDERKQAFAAEPSFHPVNIAALAPSLIESELFGHRRGAFTGAWQDREGWLASCTPLGTVFLDEIGELDVGLQVKLLRVIETRSFHAVGDTGARQFSGKLVAATNRNLAEAMAGGRFREDLYYRLCSDLITTPSLEEQVRESAVVLGELVLYMAQKVAGDEAASLARAAEEFIRGEMEPGYPWPGNYRELEQCVRNVLVRGEYRPPRARTTGVAEAIESGSLTAGEL
ncbi:MAG: sigma 54-interacting transcriptional regulator, partial [Bryobacteraceae bacterium]